MVRLATEELMDDPLDDNVAMGGYSIGCFMIAVVVVNVIALGIASSLFLFEVFLAIQLRCETTTAASELLPTLPDDEEDVSVVAPFSFVVS